MKIIRTIFFCLLALSLIACTGIFIFFQTFDTDQYLPQITKKASLALGRPVSIGHVGLGLSSRGITLDAGPVTIADDPGFTTQSFVRIDRARISMDLRSLILRREVRITHILLQSPEIHFIRSREGNINVRSIVRSNQSGMAVITKNPVDTAASPSAALGSASRNDGREHSLFSGINARSITIQDASVSFIDQNQTTPLDIWLRGINVSVNDFSFSKPFQVSLDGLLYSNAPNVHISALVLLDPLKRSIQINDLKFQTDLSQLDVNQLKDISPEMPDNSIFKSTVGVLQLNLAHLDNASGSITANGDISITGGVIKNFNIIRMLLSRAMESLGGIGSINNLFKGPLKEKFDAADTTIEKASAQFSFHDRALFIDDSLIQTDVFELTAKGSVDQGLNTDMQTTLHLNDDVSAALVNELDMLKYLMDDSKRITIGASLKGIIPHLKYKPNKDFKKKTKKAFIEGGGSILGVLLGSGKI